MRIEIQYILAALILVLTAGYFFSAKQANPDNPSQHADTQRDNNTAIILQDIPDDLNFAGERVPIEDIDIRERYDREIIINTHFHSNTILLIKKANRWMPSIIPVLREHGIPEDFAFLPFVEGGLSNDRSPKGAVGFWQLLADTARELELEVNNALTLF